MVKKTTKSKTSNQQLKEMDRISEDYDNLQKEYKNLQNTMTALNERKLLNDEGTFRQQLLISLKEGFASVTKALNDQTKLQAQINDIEVEEDEEEEEEVEDESNDEEEEDEEEEDE